MTKAVTITALTFLTLLWTWIGYCPTIEHKCLVCGETTEKLTRIEELFINKETVHFDCIKNYHLYTERLKNER